MDTPGDALLREVFARPDEDEPRQVYADWLETQGQTERAAFIRIQLELASMSEADARRPDLEDREHALLARNEADWLGALPAQVPEWKFERGFLSWLRTDTETLLDHGESLFARHPITALQLVRPGPYELGPIEALGQMSWLSRLRQLETGVFPEILQSEHLTGLTELTCHGYERDPEVLDFVLRCPSLGRLQRLGVARLLYRSWLPRLAPLLGQAPIDALDLGDCEVGTQRASHRCSTQRACRCAR